MIKINNLSAIAKKYDSSVIERLVDKYPLKEQIIRGDEELGTGSINKKNEYYSAEIELTIVSLNNIKPVIEKALSKLRKRYFKMKVLRLIAAILSSITSLGLISSVLNGKNTVLIIIISLINLATSIFLIVANNLDSPSINGKRSLPELFEKFNSLFSDAERIEKKLSRILRLNKIDDECLVTIENAEELAFSFRELERAQLI